MSKLNEYTRTCNYCGKEMENGVEVEDKIIGVCTTPDCPAFSLLQIAMEEIPIMAEFEEVNDG